MVVLPGDGKGPELVGHVLRVAEWFRAKRGFDCRIVTESYGAAAYRQTGVWASDSLFSSLASADAVLLGAIGSGPEFEAIPVEIRRNWGMLRIRREMQLFANLRPIRTRDALLSASPLRPDIARGVDLLFVREIAGGLYNGQPRGITGPVGGERRATNTLSYGSEEIRRIARLAFDLARSRGRGLTSIDKANATEVGALWREVVAALRESEYPDVPLRHLYVDICAAELVSAPRQFDVILADNMHGDILSDGAAPLAGSTGLLPTASFSLPDANGHVRALYESMDVHGASELAPDVVNPVGSVLSFALALRHSFGRADDAALLEAAIDNALVGGTRTVDIAGDGPAATTTAMVDAILLELDRADTPTRTTGISPQATRPSQKRQGA